MAREFSAVSYLFETYGFPEAENLALQIGVSLIFSNSSYFSASARVICSMLLSSVIRNTPGSSGGSGWLGEVF